MATKRPKTPSAKTVLKGKNHSKPGAPRKPIREPGDEMGPLVPPPGGGGGAPGQPPAPVDWAQITGIPGIPADVGEEFARRIAADGDDAAIAWLRTTPWHQTEYRGLAAGVGLGLFSNEGEYRAYRSAVNNSYLLNYGRAATADELEGFINQGYSAGVVGQIGAGHAYAEANRADTQYLTGAFGGGQLSEQELQSYGEQRAGRDSALGSSILAKVESAMAKVNRVFQGQNASSALGDQNLQQKPKRPDIAA